MRRILAPLALVLVLTSCGLIRPETPEDQARQRAVLTQIGEAAWRHARALALEIAGILTGEAVGASGRERTRATAREARATASETGAYSVTLERVRAWPAPVPRWDRVRLSTAADGSLLVLRPERGAVTLETAEGQVLESVPVQVQGKADFFQGRESGGHVLVRSGAALTFGGVPVASGAWETYAGLGETLLAWQPCAVRPCPASVIVRGEAGWYASAWPVEVFGLSLAAASSGTVGIASREQPNSSGWTWREVDASALASGRVVEMGARQTWRPERGQSLEDPALLSGGRLMVGGAYDLAAERVSGRVYLAEAGRPGLRLLLTAAPVDANAEPGAALDAAGVLWLAVETEAGTSGLYRYVDRRGMVLQATAPGGRPSVAAAEGRVYVSTSAGLYAMPP